MIYQAKNGKHYYETRPGKYQVGDIITLRVRDIADETAFTEEQLAAMTKRERMKARKAAPSVGKQIHEFIIDGIGQTFVTADGIEQCRYYGVERTREEVQS